MRGHSENRKPREQPGQAGHLRKESGHIPDVGQIFLWDDLRLNYCASISLAVHVDKGLIATSGWRGGSVSTTLTQP